MNVRTKGHNQGKIRPIGRSQRVKNSYLPPMQKVWNEYNCQLSLPFNEKNKKVDTKNYYIVASKNTF